MPSCELDLPAGFRVDDVLAFHSRDSLQVQGGCLRKGMAWPGRAVRLDVDGSMASADEVEFASMM